MKNLIQNLYRTIVLANRRAELALHRFAFKMAVAEHQPEQVPGDPAEWGPRGVQPWCIRDDEPWPCETFRAESDRFQHLSASPHEHGETE